MLVLAYSVVLLIVACLCVGLIWRGFCVVLDASLYTLKNFFEGFSWGCIWHYSPLDREEVAMLGVGL